MKIPKLRKKVLAGQNSVIIQNNNLLVSILPVQEYIFGEKFGVLPTLLQKAIILDRHLHQFLRNSNILQMDNHSQVFQKNIV